MPFNEIQDDSLAEVCILGSAFISSVVLFRPSGTTVPCGLMFHRRCFFSLGSQISTVPRPIAAKLCHMIAIWWQSLAKVGQLGGPPLKKF